MTEVKEGKKLSISDLVRMKMTLTVKEVKDMLGYESLYIRKLCRDKVLKSVKVSGVWYISEESVREFLKKGGNKSKKRLQEENIELQKRIEELERQLKGK